MVFTLKALIVVIMGGVGNLLGGLIAGLILGLIENYVATFVDPGSTLAATYAIFLVVLLVGPRPVRQGQPMTARRGLASALAALGCSPACRCLGDSTISRSPSTS